MSLQYRSKAEIEREKALAWEKKEKEKHEALWGWKEDGRKAKERLDKQFSRVEGIIGPHQHKKAMVHLLDKFSHRARHNNNQFRRPVGMWLLRTIMNHKTRGKVQPKSGMIVTKWNMLAGIRKVRELDMSVCLIPVEKLLIKNVRVKPDVVLELKEKRDAVVNSFADYKRVLDTVDSCNAMRECRSLNHMKPAGCPMCGGIESVRGLHVISVHRTSGEKTLLSWDLEMENLAKEDQTQRNLYDAAVREVVEYEKSLFYVVVSAIQNWWCVYLARKRNAGQQKRLLHSQYYYGIRRLAKIKRRIDREIADNKLDADKLRRDFPDYNLEISEHMSKIAAIKAAQNTKVAKQFLLKLRNAVMKTRKKKFQREENARQEVKKREAFAKAEKGRRELADMKLRLKALEKRNLVCLRPECNYREFKSQERFDTHMSLHMQRDVEYKKILKQNRENERMRWEKETNYRGKLKHINESLVGVRGEGDDEAALVVGGGLGATDGIPDGLSLSTHSWADFSEFDQASLGGSAVGWGVGGPDGAGTPGDGIVGEMGDLSLIESESGLDSGGDAGGAAVESAGDAAAAEGSDVLGPLVKRGSSAPLAPRTPSAPKPRLGSWMQLEKARDKTVAGIDWSVVTKPSSPGSRPGSVGRPRSPDQSTIVSTSTDGGMLGDGDTDGGMSTRSMTSQQKREHIREKERQRERDHGAIVFDKLPPPAEHMTPRELDWTAVPHLSAVSADLHSNMCHLELLSKHGDVDVPARVPLNKPVVRFGALQGLECTLKTFGFCRKYMMVSKIHCLIYVPMADCKDEPIRVCDNRSLWGTYVVNRNGAYKAPVKVGSGTALTAGDLICIGVRPKGPDELTPEIAGQACCVYRVRNLPEEEAHKTHKRGSP